MGCGAGFGKMVRHGTDETDGVRDVVSWYGVLHILCTGKCVDWGYIGWVREGGALGWVDKALRHRGLRWRESFFGGKGWCQLAGAR